MHGQHRDIGKERGFTLVEMVMTMAMLAILVGIAVPSFRSMMLNNRAASTANALVQVITNARSEAVKRQAMVALCKSADGKQCTDSGGWDQGVLTVRFSDTNGDGRYAIGEQVLEILRADVPFTKGSDINGVGGLQNQLSYNPAGRTSVAATGHFNIVPKGGDEKLGRKVYVFFARAQVRGNS